MDTQIVHCSCLRCGQRFEFSAQDLGMEIACPVCQQNTRLYLEADSRPIIARDIPPPTHPQESDKRILSAFLLCLLFGVFGAHAFYAGRKWEGRFYLLGLLGLYAGYVMRSMCPKGEAALYASNDAIITGSIIVTAVASLFELIMFIRLIVDLIQIIATNYTDGCNRKITKWV